MINTTQYLSEEGVSYGKIDILRLISIRTHAIPGETSTMYACFRIWNSTFQHAGCNITEFAELHFRIRKRKMVRIEAIGAQMQKGTERLYEIFFKFITMMPNMFFFFYFK